jgi:Domain of unknown function (DUF4303)
MNLQDAIREAAGRAFSSLRQAYPSDDFYYFALVTTSDALRPGPSASSMQGLERTFTDYRARGFASEPADIRWSEADSPYDGFGDEHFAEVEQLFLAHGDHRDLPGSEFEAEVARRWAAMEGALRELDAEGFFGTGVTRERVVINVVAPGDESEETVIARAARLNPPVSLIQLRQDLGGASR